MRARAPEPVVEEQAEPRPKYLIVAGYACLVEGSESVDGFILPGDVIDALQLDLAAFTVVPVTLERGRACAPDAVRLRAIEERRRLIRILGLREAEAR